MSRKRISRRSHAAPALQRTPPSEARPTTLRELLAQDDEVAHFLATIYEIGGMAVIA